MSTRAGTGRFRGQWGNGLLVAALLLGGAADAAAATPFSAKHKKWLEEEVPYLISDEEKKLFRQLPTDAERDRFIDDFWLARDPSPGTPENEYRDEHYRRIEHANQYFSEGRGHNGWRTDRGRMYIALGKPQQVTKYPWHSAVRPMELWFYSNTHRSLPGFFYLLFYQPDDASDYRLYSPVVDGPTKLAKGSGTENNPRGAFRQLAQQVSAEVARASLTFLTDEPIDTESFTATMASDSMVTRIYNLPNDRFTKEMLRRRRELKEVVKTRLTFEPEVLEVEWVPLRDADGETAVHQLLLLPATLEELAAKAGDQYQVTARVNTLVRTAGGEPLFQQTHSGTYTYTAEAFERLKLLPFAYEDRLPLPPGDYDLDFVFQNEITGALYLARQQVNVPDVAGALRLSPLVVYEEAVRVEDPSGARPFEFFDLRFTPSGRNEFGRGEKLKVFFQVYLPPPGTGYAVGDTLQVDYALGSPTRGGTRTSESEQIATQQFDAHGTVLHGKAFSLNDFEPGSFRLVVTVTDPATGQSASQTLAFKVAQVGGNLGRTTIVNGRLAEDTRRGWLDYRRALCQAGQNRPEEALRLLERALERNPNLSPARDKLATLLFQRGDHARVATLAAGATIAPDTGLDAILAYLAALEEAGQRTKAIELGEQAVAVLAPAGSLYEEMAALYEKSGQGDRAREMRDRARQATASRKPASN